MDAIRKSKEEHEQERKLALEREKEQVFVPDRSKLIHVELSDAEYEKLTPHQQDVYRKRKMLYKMKNQAPKVKH